MKRLDACLLYAAPKQPFVHNLPARHMLLTILPPPPSASTRHSILQRSWMPDTLESGEGDPSWSSLRALANRLQQQRRAFEPASALRLGQEERAGRAH